jgi:valyl-tRNA synthetase
VPPGQEISASLYLESELVSPVKEHQDYFAKLAKVSDLTVSTDAAIPPASASVVVGRNQVFVPLEGMIDLEVERDRIRKEIEDKREFLKSVEEKLSNESFVSRAPAEVVEKERSKATEIREELDRLESGLAELA